MKKTNNENGITLIALVITIIVLLILVAVSITMLTGKNGILTKASNAKELQEEADAKETLQIELLGIKTNVMHEKNRETVVGDVSELENNDNVKNDIENIVYIDENETEVEIKNAQYAIVTYKKYIFKIDKNLNIVDSQKSGEVVEEEKDVTLIKGNEEYKFECVKQCKTVKAYKSGYYEIKCYGGAGGNSLANNAIGAYGGKGSLVSGQIYLNKNDKLYLYVGEKGEDAKYKKDSVGGYNGGGLGTWDNEDDEAAGAGGGATDVRLIKGDSWDDFESLKSRIMVAAGGGGSSWKTAGGAGGELEGKTNREVAKPGTQISGYKFGKGQDGYGTGNSNGVAGSGSGYYGGTTNDKADDMESGAGGSSFISGYSGCNAISKESTEENIIHTNQEKHYSGKVFVNSRMVADRNDGNGYIEIKYIGDEPKEIYYSLYDECKLGDFVKYDAGDWNESSEIKDGEGYSFEYNQGESRNKSVYETTYTGGWRVLKRQENKVYLVSAGIPFKMRWYGNYKSPQTCFSAIKNECEKFVNNKYAEEGRSILLDEKDDLKNSNTLTIGGEYWIVNPSKTDCWIDTITASGGSDWWRNYSKYMWNKTCYNFKRKTFNKC